MIKNGIKMLIVSLLLVAHVDIFAVVSRKNAQVEKIHNNLQNRSSEPQSSKSQTNPKNASKSRQRMSAGKIVGIAILISLGAAAFGALVGLVWFGINLFLLFCGL